MKGKPRRVPGEGYEGVSVQKLENQPGVRGHPSRLPGGGARGEPGPRWSRAEGRVPRGQGRVAAASRPLPRWCRAAGARVPWSGGQRPSPASAPRQVWPCDLGFSPRHVGHEEPRGGCGGPILHGVVALQRRRAVSVCRARGRRPGLGRGRRAPVARSHFASSASRPFPPRRPGPALPVSAAATKGPAEAWCTNTRPEGGEKQRTRHPRRCPEGVRCSRPSSGGGQRPSPGQTERLAA